MASDSDAALATALEGLSGLQIAPADKPNAPTPVIPYEQAVHFRDVCYFAAWHMANERKSYTDDAAADKRRADTAAAALTECASLGPDVTDGLVTLAWTAARHTTKVRSGGEATATEPDLLKHEMVKEALAGTLGRAAAESASLVAMSAGWHASCRRFDGDESERARDSLVALVREFHKLGTVPRRKWVGVNLGGWLLLEWGPSTPLFQQQSVAQDGEYEWAVSEALREQGVAQEVFGEHRGRHVTAAELRHIAAIGCNAVRLPFGYWVVTGPSAPSGDCAQVDPYVGPCLEVVDRLVADAAEAGLQVMLDLHGNPGGESGDKPCGREDADWNFDRWRRDEAIEVLRTVAARYARSDSVVALQVCNEPSRSIPPAPLVAHYAAAARAIREAGMSAERVAIVCPMYYEDEDDVAQFLSLWLSQFRSLDNCVLDLHEYYFGDWANEGERGPLGPRLTEEAQRLATAFPASVVGEWSAARPPDVTRVSAASFFERQLLEYTAASTHGSFFWNWTDGSGPDWSLRSSVRGRRDAIAAAAASAAAAVSWDVSYVAPETEPWERCGDGEDATTETDSAGGSAPASPARRSVPPADPNTPVAAQYMY